MLAYANLSNRPEFGRRPGGYVEQSAAIQTASDMSRLGIAVMNPEGTMELCNAPARQLASRIGIALGNGRKPCFDDAATERSFRAAWLAALGHPEAGAQLLQLRQREVLAVLTAMGQSGRIAFTLADVPRSRDIASLMQTYALTPAECRLARHIASGRRLADAARAFGVSLHTVRNQLRAIFVKTGARRQAELTRMLLDGAQLNS